MRVKAARSVAAVETAALSRRERLRPNAHTRTVDLATVASTGRRPMMRCRLYSSPGGAYSKGLDQLIRDLDRTDRRRSGGATSIEGCAKIRK